MSQKTENINSEELVNNLNEVYDYFDNRESFEDDIIRIRKDEINEKVIKILSKRDKDECQIISFPQDSENTKNFKSYIGFLHRLLSRADTESIDVLTKNVFHKGLFYSDDSIIREVISHLHNDREVNFLLLNEINYNQDNALLRSVSTNRNSNRFNVYPLYNIEELKKCDNYDDVRCIVVGNSGKITTSNGNTIFFFNLNNNNTEDLTNLTKLKNVIQDYKQLSKKIENNEIFDKFVITEKELLTRLDKKLDKLDFLEIIADSMAKKTNLDKAWEVKESLQKYKVKYEETIWEIAEDNRNNNQTIKIEGLSKDITATITSLDNNKFSLGEKELNPEEIIVYNL